MKQRCILKYTSTKLQVFFKKTTQVTVNVCNRFVISTVFEPFIKRKPRKKRFFLCFTAYIPKTFCTFAVLIKKTRCKTALQNVGSKKEETNYEKECK